MRSPTTRSLTVLAFALLAATPALAQKPVELDEVEYISGFPGLEDRKAKGVLVVTADSLILEKKNGDRVWKIANVHVTEVSRQTDIRDGSVGKKLLFGGLAGSRKQEFLNIAVETEDEAFGVVIKTKQGESANALSKVRFAVRKAREKAGLAAPKSGEDDTNDAVVTQ